VNEGKDYPPHTEERKEGGSFIGLFGLGVGLLPTNRDVVSSEQGSRTS